jgi:hypothetical protein
VNSSGSAAVNDRGVGQKKTCLAHQDLAGVISASRCDARLTANPIAVNRVAGDRRVPVQAFW